MEIRKWAAGPSPSEEMKVRDTFILLNVFPPKWIVKMSTVQAINCGETQFFRRVKGWVPLVAGSVWGGVTSCSIWGLKLICMRDNNTKMASGKLDPC